VSRQQKPKLATIGCGYFSQFHHQAWQRLPVDHVGVCDLGIGRAEQFRETYGAQCAYTDYAEMLQQLKPDLVDIVLPPDLHLEAITAALNAGADVICQKPFTLSTDQAEAAVALAKEKQRTLVVHENFRFQPWYRRLKTLLSAEDCGALYKIQFNLRPGDGQGPNAYLDRQPYFQEMEQFLIKETGVHFIDLFRYLIGQPRAVYADLFRLNPSIRGEDAGLFIMEFDDGARAVFDGNRLADHAAENPRLTMGEMLVETEYRIIKLDGNGGLWQRVHGSNQWVQVDLIFNNENFGGDCVFLLQQHILECLQNGVKPENQAQDYLDNLRIQEAIYQSDRESRKISLSNLA
jgi:predicted dehydrogenase